MGAKVFSFVVGLLCAALCWYYINKKEYHWAIIEGILAIINFYCTFWR